MAYLVALSLVSASAVFTPADAAQLTLTWTINSTNETGFTVERSQQSVGSFGEITIVGAGQSTYVDAAVDAGTTYCYRVRAFNDTGYSAYSNETCASTGQTYSLTVVKFGTGNGTVVSNPTGINCGGDCSEVYASGTAVALAASAASGSTFAGWSGDSDCADGVVTVDASKTCMATFDAAPAPTTETAPSPTTFVLTVAKAGTGSGTVTSSPAGISCGTECSSSYPNGTQVALTAAAASGSTFAGWSGDSDCADGVVSVDAAKTCAATFDAAAPALTTFALTVTKVGAGSGSVSSFPAGISCGSECSWTFPVGSRVMLTPTAEPGSTFVGWRGDGDCKDGVITVSGDTACKAFFKSSSRGGGRPRK